VKRVYNITVIDYSHQINLPRYLLCSMCKYGSFDETFFVI